MKVLVSGSLAYDKILDFPGRFADHIMPEKIHNLSLSFVTDNLSENFGGTAGNIAYNLALLGVKPTVLSAAGNDFDPYHAWLEAKGVDLSLVTRVKDRPTAFVTIMTDREDNQIAGLYLGAMAEPCRAKDTDIPEAAIAVVSAGNVEDMRRFIALHRKRETLFIFDPGQQTPSLSAEDIKNGTEGASVLIVNDYELALVLQKTGWTEDEILEHAEGLVVTMGGHGSRIRTRKGEIKIPAAKVGVVKDPTGAGDAYRAGFIVGLIKKWPLPVIGRFASVIAAFAVEGVGPQFHNFSFHEAWARYTENFGSELSI